MAKKHYRDLLLRVGGIRVEKTTRQNSRKLLSHEKKKNIGIFNDRFRNGDFDYDLQLTIDRQAPTLFGRRYRGPDLYISISIGTWNNLDFVLKDIRPQEYTLRFLEVYLQNGSKKQNIYCFENEADLDLWKRVDASDSLDSPRHWKSEDKETQIVVPNCINKFISIVKKYSK